MTHIRLLDKKKNNTGFIPISTRTDPRLYNCVNIDNNFYKNKGVPRNKGVTSLRTPTKFDRGTKK